MCWETNSLAVYIRVDLVELRPFNWHRERKETYTQSSELSVHLQCATPQSTKYERVETPFLPGSVGTKTLRASESEGQRHLQNPSRTFGFRDANSTSWPDNDKECHRHKLGRTRRKRNACMCAKRNVGCCTSRRRKQEMQWTERAGRIDGAPINRNEERVAQEHGQTNCEECHR